MLTMIKQPPNLRVLMSKIGMDPTTADGTDLTTVDGMITMVGMTTIILDGPDTITLDGLDRAIRPTFYRHEPLELLVLSACSTASGDDRVALGLAGVALKAVARSTIASHSS